MDFIEILKAILFGIVEGITEWLPISSTGHMIILDELVKLNVSDAFREMFLVVIQLGAILQHPEFLRHGFQMDIHSLKLRVIFPKIKA